MASKVKVGSEVVVIAGNSKGKHGKILGYKNERVVVEGAAMIKKHVKPSQDNQKGGVVEREGSIHISNVMLKERYDAKKSKKTTPAIPKSPKKDKKK